MMCFCSEQKTLFPAFLLIAYVRPLSFSVAFFALRFAGFLFAGCIFFCPNLNAF